MKWLILLLSCCSCLGQAFSFADPTVHSWGGSTAVAASYNPTNNSDGVTPSLWLLADDLSSSPVGTWTDRTTNAHAFGASGASRPALLSANLNGHNVVWFNDGTGNTLKNSTYSNIQPHELVFVMSLTNRGSIVFTATNAFTEYFSINANQFRLNAPSGESVGNFNITNKWCVYDIIFDGASTRMYTNNVSIGAFTNPGTDPMFGLNIGGDPFFTLFNIAEFLTYHTTNSATARLNLYSYLTNRYAIVP